MANLLSTTVNGNLITSGGYTTSNYTRILYPSGGSYVTTTSVITGAIRIKLPTQGSAMMMTCTVKVYEYSTNKSFTITFGGHRDSNNWYNEFCYLDGDSARGNLTVRFGVDDGKDCVWIGDTSTQWSYPQVFVTDVQLGYTGYNQAWASGWSVGFVTSFATVNRTQTAYAKITNANIGSQSVNYASSAGNADTVDGYHESSFWRDGQNRPIGVLRFTGEGGDSGNGSIATSYGIYQQGGAWTHPYPDLCIGFHTGIKIGGYYGYGGTRFYNNSDWVTEIFSVGNGDNHVRVANNLYAGGLISTTAASSRFGNILIGDGTYKNTIKPVDDVNLNMSTPSGAVYFDTYGQASGSFRAPIFYDSNNTNYYLDPNSTTSGYFAGVLRQNDGKYVRDAYYRTISGYGDLFSGGAAGWTTIAEITLAYNCSGAVLYGTLFDHRYDGADAYQLSIVARSECDFTSNNDSHYVNVGCTITGSTAIGNYRDKIRLLLVYSVSGARTYELQVYETAWNHNTWQLESTGWTIHTSAQSVKTGLEGAKVNYISNQNADYQRANEAMYSPIYYDSNDTGYYLDPNGTSNLIQLTTSTRARWNMPRIWHDRSSQSSNSGYWTGTNGWGTSQGTWANAWKGGFSGWDIWGANTDHPQGSGDFHAQGIVSGIHYASSDGSDAYGWMMVGAHAATDNRYWLRGKWGATTSGWVEMITTGNISSQSVNYAASAGNITSQSPQIAASVESNSIYVTSPSYTTGQITKPMIFDWYGNYWAIGNIRSGATPSDGFGISYRNNTPIHVFTTTGMTINGNTVIHAGNIGSQSVSVAKQLLSPNGETRVSADSAMPSVGNSFFHTLALGPGDNDGHILGMTWTGTSVYGAQIFLDTDPNDIMAIRSRSSTGVWTSWKTIIHSGNISSQSVSYATSAGSAPNGSNVNSFYNVTAGDGNGLRFWGGSNAYKISMGVGSLYQYGTVSDYSIKMQMDNDSNGRGFTWGRESSAPIASLNSKSGDFQVAGNVYAPIFYDSNDTNYFVDPNSISQLNYVLANNWFRPQGSTGLYFQTYGRGIWSADSAGASYGNVSIYGDGINSWPGYAINNLAIFMARDIRRGIFIPSADSWLIRYEQSSNMAFVDFELQWGSDIRYKSNIKRLTGALDTVKRLKAVTYNYKGNERTSIGFIAQEVEPVLPEVVSTDADGFKSIGYANIVSLLSEAIKEQQVMIEQLKARIDILESK